jgi:hypothetical protein
VKPLPSGPNSGGGQSLSDEGETRAALQKSLLHRLEQEIDLPAWLVARGFQVAPHQPDPARLAMTSPSLEMFLLRKDPERGGWSYFNTSDPTERGSVVDFMSRRDGATFETCVNRLAGCVTRSQLTPEGIAYHEVLRDRGHGLHAAESLHVEAVKAEREATRALDRLGIERGSLDEWRFGRIRTEEDVGSLMRNPTTLEHSRYRHGDRVIVFVERPIDAVAYERTHGKQRACYVYTGDDPTLETKRQIAHLLADVPAGVKAVLAFARDRRGDELAAEIARLAPALNPERQGPRFGVRWAEQMQLEHRHHRSLQRVAGIER